ncbi:YkuS family protein [Tissierella sp. MSJ-40]|uniref:YkuS family protein n=1 Tax=Tissierella simiarum TaxID=2841534 RepID=A0ABS6E5R3_9FIRM|nr:YkuS family protein [Tissierella simiarum]MBU5438117.1 YkuS family protein [Tissierella simiarum]
MKKIGVEKGLDNVAEFLTNEGYSVQMLSESIDDNISKLDGLDAIVAAGYNTNMLGYSDTETKAPVVNASGLSPQEVKDMLDRQTSR